MKATFQIEKPMDCQCTLSITMPLAHWCQLREQLSSSDYPSWKFRGAIMAMVCHAEKHFEANETVPQ